MSRHGLPSALKLIGTGFHLEQGADHPQFRFRLNYIGLGQDLR